MNIQGMLKPATITSIGLITIAASLLFQGTSFELSPSVLKAGAALVIAGTLWFFYKTR